MVPIEVGERIHIPGNIKDLASFRRWARSKQFPERGRFAFLSDRLWMELDMEKLFTHNRLKVLIGSVLDQLARSAKLGYFFGDRAFLTNEEASLSTEPDGMFVSFPSLRQERICFKDEIDEPIELIGSPDMVLEVVSKNSVRKDTRTLRELYWMAEVAEYWLVDARGEGLKFDLLKRGVKGYTNIRPQDGWVKSKVFGRAFRLTNTRMTSAGRISIWK